MNYGFKRPSIKIEDHIFGAEDNLPVIQPDGQYDNFIPQYEAQADKYETGGCTIWGSQNGVEFLFKKLFNIEPNYDERYNYNISEVSFEEGGADPGKVIQDMREKGLIQGFLPMPDTLPEFMTPRPMEEKYLKEGRKWLDQYELKHKWVLQGFEEKGQRIQAIQEALTKGIVCVSVTAWYEQNGIYVDMAQQNNHWCVCYGWTGNGWKIFDSYNNSTKIYSFDSRIDFAKLLTIIKKVQPEPSNDEQYTDIGNAIINLIKRFFNWIFK